MSTPNETILQTSILEYQSLLSEYQTKYNAYISALTGNSLTFTIANKSKYANLNTISNVVVANQSLCKDKCSSTNLCNGANYNSDTQECSLFGNAAISPILSGTDTEFAIYSNIKTLHDELVGLNIKLLDKNQEIFELINEDENNYNADRSEIDVNNANIEQNYIELYNEKEKINNLFHEFETYIEKDVSTKTEANRNYIIYVLLFFILIVIFIILIKTIML